MSGIIIITYTYTATSPIKATQQNSAQIDLRKKLMFTIDFPQIVNLSNLQTEEMTNLEPFLLF